MSRRIAVLLLLFALLQGTCSSQLDSQWIFEIKAGNDNITRNVEYARNRADTGAITTFKDGSSQKDVWFPEGGTNDTAEINLPTSITITEASMVLEGKPLGGSITQELSFNDTVNSSAWWGGTGGAPTGSPSDYKDNAYLVASYVELKNRDDIRLRTLDVKGEYAYQHFSFHQSFSDVTSFDILYEGGGMAVPEMGFATGGIKLYIHDASGPSWEMVDQFTPGEVWDERVLARTYNMNVMDYIDQQGNIHLVATTFIGGPGLTAWVDTDFINIMITGSKQDAYPMDPYLNVGGIGPKEWEHEGAFTGAVTINNTYGFRISLQELIDQEEQNENIDIFLSLYSAGPGVIELKELMIEYEIIPENQPPSPVGDLHNGTFTFPEDSEGGMGLIDLHEFFDDDGGQDNISFTILKNSLEVVASLNTSSHSLDFTSRKDFFGKRDFQVRASDKDGSSTDSSVFTVTVTPTNDAPYLVQFGDEMEPHPDEILELEALEGEMTDFDFTAWDVDGDIPQFSFGPSFTYHDIFLIRTYEENASRGTILVEPGNEHAGTINFSLIIDDNNRTGGSSLESKYNISLEVINANDAPVMDDITTKKGYQDQWLNFTISAGDIDFINDEDEKLVYKTNFSEADIDPGKWNMDEDTGNFSFLPDNSLVGIYKINFSVEDNGGKSDWTHAVMEISNVNDPPVAEPIDVHIADSDPTTTIIENLTINVSTGEAKDPDLIHGDILTYYWDFDGDEVSDRTGLNAEWTYGEAGNYSVTLTVQDSGIPVMTNSSSILIEVLAPPDPDGNNGNGEDDDDEDDDKAGRNKDEDRGAGGTVLVIIVLAVIMLIIVAGVITFFVVGKKRKGKGGEGANTPPIHQQAAPPVITDIPHQNASAGSFHPPAEPTPDPIHPPGQRGQMPMQYYPTYMGPVEPSPPMAEGNKQDTIPYPQFPRSPP